MITEFIQNNPRIAMMIISLLVAVFTTVITYFLTDKEKMKELKQRQTDLRKEMKLYKDNPQKMMEINKKMLENLPEQMKMSLKPTLITMIPLLIMLAWLKSTFEITAIASSWIWYYIAFVLVFTIILRKIFGLQ